jgi:hypothetical protein
MSNNENNDGTIQQLEYKLSGYFSLYSARPEYKLSLQKQLLDNSSEDTIVQARRREKRIFEYLHYRPAYKWIGVLGLIILIFIMLFAIRPVRAAIERLIDFGYLEGGGFVRVSETYVLAGPIYSVKQDQTIGVDRVIADLTNTKIWLHETGLPFYGENVNVNLNAYLEVNGQELPLTQYGGSASTGEYVLVFGTLGSAISNPFTLRVGPDWSIPIQLIPMSSMDQKQATTIYPDLCQTHLDVELCLRTFVSDSTGYHLWLSASSQNPSFYLQTLFLDNPPLTNEGAILTDSSGHQLTPVYSSEPAVAMQVSPVITDTFDEVKTYLSFERSANESGSLELQISGLTGKTPADATIVCRLGGDPQIGDRFACEKSVSIAGETIRFHEGEITQHPDGVHLTIESDPIEATNGYQLNFVNAESLYYENSSLVGVGFDSHTNKLEIWLGMDSVNQGKQFAVKITSAELMILEPYKFTWKIRP